MQQKHKWNNGKNNEIGEKQQRNSVPSEDAMQSDRSPLIDGSTFYYWAISSTRVLLFATRERMNSERKQKRTAVVLRETETERQRQREKKKKERKKERKRENERKRERLREGVRGVSSVDNHSDSSIS